MSEELLEDILEPRKKYNQQLARQHLDNVTEYFEDLVRQANVDAAANKATCQKIYTLESQIEALRKKEARGKGLFALALVGFFILLFAGVIMIMIGNGGGQAGLIVGGIFALVAAAALIIFSIIRRSKNSKAIAELIKNKTAELEELKRKAYGQMAALNNLYEWNIYNILMGKTVPLIKMDRVFDMEKYNQLRDKFKYKDPNNINHSTVLAQSGSILGNPFVIYREYIQSMVNYTYTGSIVIHWTENVPDGKGGSYVRARSQTLYASVVKPKPSYHYSTKLVYGNEAAPDLTFSRSPMDHGYSDGDLKSFFKRQEKVVDEYRKKHPTFTPLGNDEFEDFFGGLDRDHEVQYRLLFTPLAQKSMLDILTHPDPYGDDFSFYKEKMVNTIVSAHSQAADYDGDPSVFYHFDLEKARENFINRNVNYFRGVFFDLAPLLAIPLYQQYPTNEYIFKRDIGADYSRHLSEMEANRFKDSYFEPAECITPIILKSEFHQQVNNVHSVGMHAYGFKGIEHTDYISKLGGDGRHHEVPVKWIEYVPVEKVTPFIVQATDVTRRQFFELANTSEYAQFLNKNVANNAILVSRGLFSFINRQSQYSADELSNAIEKILGK